MTEFKNLKMPATNSGQAQFGHFGKLNNFVFLYLYRRLKDFGHQTQTAPSRKTLGVMAHSGSFKAFLIFGHGKS